MKIYYNMKNTLQFTDGIHSWVRYIRKGEMYLQKITKIRYVGRRWKQTQSCLCNNTQRCNNLQRHNNIQRVILPRAPHQPPHQHLLTKLWHQLQQTCHTFPSPLQKGYHNHNHQYLQQ